MTRVVRRKLVVALVCISPQGWQEVRGVVPTGTISATRTCVGIKLADICFWRRIQGTRGLALSLCKTVVFIALTATVPYLHCTSTTEASSTSSIHKLFAFSLFRVVVPTFKVGLAGTGLGISNKNTDPLVHQRQQQVPLQPPMPQQPPPRRAMILQKAVVLTAEILLYHRGYVDHFDDSDSRYSCCQRKREDNDYCWNGGNHRSI